MVVFVDFEDEAEDPHAGFPLPGPKPINKNGSIAVMTRQNVEGNLHERPNPNLNATSAALGCYPCVSPAISSYITK